MKLPAPRFEMTLEELFAGVAQVEAGADTAIRDMKLDSRQVNPGDLFVALRGSEMDGTAFIDKAIKRGAVAVAIDASQAEAANDCAVPVIRVDNIKAKLGELADRFFLHPSQQLSGGSKIESISICCLLGWRE